MTYLLYDLIYQIKNITNENYFKFYEIKDDDIGQYKKHFRFRR